MEPSLRIDPGDRASIGNWLATWGQCVAAVDFARAQALFHPQVVGFGTHADFVVGLDNLAAEQWRSVWPTIRDFRFDVEGLSAATSPDRLFGYLAARWSSTGIGEDGATFDRPGRCTVVLQRRDVAAAWLGIHTHFALDRGVPQRSYGQADRR